MTHSALPIAIATTTEQALAILNQFKIERPKYRSLMGGTTYRHQRANLFNAGTMKKTWYGVQFDNKNYYMSSKEVAEFVLKAIIG